MTQQHVAEELKNYFNVLLADVSDEAIEAMASPPVPAVSVTNTAAQDEQESSEPLKESQDVVNSVSSVSSALTTTPTPKSTTIPITHGTSHDGTGTSHDGSGSDGTGVPTEALEGTDNSQNDSSQVVSKHTEDQPLLERGHLTTSSAERAIDPSKPSELSLEPSSTLPADTPTSSSTYEQHKQRLEKMLNQVSALETKPDVEQAINIDSALTKPATDTPVESETAVVADSPLTGGEQNIELAHHELPPLSTEWLENGRPNWAQEKFDILLIEVSGLQLAMPLAALGQIQAIDDTLTPLFGQSDWFLGLQKTPIGHVKTVSTTKFVMPERFQEEHDYQFVVSINGLPWGLAVDSIRQPITVSPDDIRWRARRTHRKWMAGTLKDHMCVLLDIPSMGEILQQEDHNADSQ